LHLLLERAAQLGVDLTRLCKIVVDGGYVGEKLVRWVMDSWGWILEKVLRPKEKRGFCLVPKRWVVDRTFGGFRWCRHFGRDDERKPLSAQSWLYIASIRYCLNSPASEALGLSIYAFPEVLSEGTNNV
jgi:putative transposase